MKKFLIGAAICVVILFIVDTVMLKDQGVVENVKQLDQYEKLDVKTLEVGIQPKQIAPNFTLTDLYGEAIQLHDYHGKRVLLNFWASWCPPCKAEMPDMQEVYNQYKDDDVVVLAVNLTHTEDSEQAVANYVEENEYHFVVPLDEVGETAYQYEVLAYPTSYFIDSDGIIRKKVSGAMSKEMMESELNKLP
ncbi:TlpA family protein disulfide reductase [Cytobacillus spongiae]|jgi:peroxiredoxin|uniref:TlpA disulfide reductase family protein n=1 Tax=Cytobacillus spongiae TaxID=2901381 RepID=UPI001F2E59A5|nr:TlpA disulfide reductase family protein [Cytobacillus spongiae]UII54430.1 TlpA family protein disulfide reductase [Cytobacillus spongiae]